MNSINFIDFIQLTECIEVAPLTLAAFHLLSSSFRFRFAEMEWESNWRHALVTFPSVTFIPFTFHSVTCASSFSLTYSSRFMSLLLHSCFISSITLNSFTYHSLFIRFPFVHGGPFTHYNLHSLQLTHSRINSFPPCIRFTH